MSRKGKKKPKKTSVAQSGKVGIDEDEKRFEFEGTLYIYEIPPRELFLVT